MKSLIVLEGNDGSGKSTVARGLTNRLADEGIDAIYTREPGGSPRAEIIRQIMLDTPCPLTQLWLMSASRTEHITTTILPAIRDGKVVICDRFMPSTYAYQVAGGGVDLKIVNSVNNYIMQHTGIEPILMHDCITVVLDTNFDTAYSRLMVKDRNVLDVVDRDRFNIQREAYLNLSRYHNMYAFHELKKHVPVIDTTQYTSVTQVINACYQLVV